MKGYAKRVDKPWGYELHWVPAGQPYMGKIIHIAAGKRLSLQAHEQKTESWLVIGGRVKLVAENSQGELEEVELEPGKGYTSHIGQKHRLAAVTDCDVVEVSTPEIGTTFRLEDDYGRPDETQELRAKPDRGWPRSELSKS